MVLIAKVMECRNKLDYITTKLQAALQEEVCLVDKVQQLEMDKAALEERVTQLAGEGDVMGGIHAELEESSREVCRLKLAVEEHEAAAKQVLVSFRQLPKQTISVLLCYFTTLAKQTNFVLLCYFTSVWRIIFS